MLDMTRCRGLAAKTTSFHLGFLGFDSHGDGSHGVDFTGTTLTAVLKYEKLVDIRPNGWPSVRKM